MMHIQLFVDDPDPLQRLITVEAVRPPGALGQSVVDASLPSATFTSAHALSGVAAAPHQGDAGALRRSAETRQQRRARARQRT
ncbi:hypothetical protein D3875_02800 [Deinococcus cavernae]|uniref:Uncharacterized protein n=1 Tax=Deinococcus cavernae TaxID=2320857 RepID=A0A418VFW5_9DEIO|nr:hypothetical protein [Deinococcus cavernae]RJF74941.1 hypothetical protein D3875_02800 [Deinococcus cavernae]